MFNKRIGFKGAVKKAVATVLLLTTIMSSSVCVYAGTVSDSAYTCLGSEGTMYVGIRVGENLAQGDISTDVISDMYIDGECTYTDVYQRTYTKSMLGAREQDYSCVAFISKANTLFTWAELEYTAYDNDGTRAYQRMELTY